MAHRYLAVAVLLLFSSIAGAQQAQRDILAQRFQSQLSDVARNSAGVLGIAVVDIDGERVFGVNESLEFPQGSAIKVAILVTLYVRQERGELDLDDTLAVTAADRVGGTGYLAHFGDGTSSLSLHDLAVLMITVSDNMATNMLIEQAGMANVNAVMAELGLDRIRLQRRMIREEQSARGNENLATPEQAAALMKRILQCDLPLAADDCKEMQAVLAIPHEGPVADGTPADVRLLQKSGSITGVRTSWAVAELEGRPYALAVMGNYGDTAAISNEIREVAELAHGYFMRLAGATRYGTRVPVELLERVQNRQAGSGKAAQ